MEFYDFEYSHWIQCPSDYPHTITKTDAYLFLRCQGVQCEDFSQHLATVMRRKPHHRHFMTNERKSVKQAMRTTNAKPAINIISSSEGDDSEVEFVDSPYLRFKKQITNPIPATSSKQPVSPSGLSDFSSNKFPAQSTSNAKFGDERSVLTLSRDSS